MAKRKKKQQEETAQLPPQVSAAILGVFVLLALLGGLGILWQTWQATSASNVQPQLEALKLDLAKRIDQRVEALQAQMDAAVADAHLRADVAAGSFEDAQKRLQEGWPELVEAGVYAPSLDAVFSADIADVGFGKLALLTRAVTANGSVADIVGRGEALSLGLAAPIKEAESAVQAIAYGRLPLDILLDMVNKASLPGGYLEMRIGQRVLVQQGDQALRHEAVFTPLKSIPLRIGSFAPVYQSTLPYPAPVQLGMGVGLLLMAGFLAMKLRKQVAVIRGNAGVVEPTMADVLKQQVTETPQRTPSESRTTPAIKKEEKKPTLALSRSIFRAYDIRGVVGKTLDQGIARLIGQSIGTVMAERGLQEIVVGRDGRLSGPNLCDGLIEGLRLAGRDVIDIGLAPTPVVYFASYHLQAGSCVALTGSHNPPDYNGFKIVLGGETLSGEAIEDLYLRIADGLLDGGGNGGLQSVDVEQDYITRIANDIQLERPLKVVVDAGNGVAGGIAPQVLEAIGAEVVPLYCEVDGEFPNHHPDPSDPANMEDLRAFVAQLNADIGLAFDGDGDRLGVVTKAGEIIYPDRLLMLFARDVLIRNPGATIIYDVKCTGHLAGQILRNGGSPLMWKTGHSLIKAKMRETGAELAGEMSGHFFFKERWYGFDDGIYAAVRLLEILASDDREPDEIFEELPKGVSTPELKVEMEEGEHYAFIERFVENAQFEGARISTIDGVRADWPDGWGLVRCSNTTPCLVLRFDADDEAALKRIKETFRSQLLALDDGLTLPF